MNDKKRILYVIGSLQTGGAERQLALLARNIVSYGYTAKIFVLKRNQGEILDELEAAGISVIDGKCNHVSSRNIRLYLLFRACLLLLRECLIFKPNIIHSFLPLTNFIAVICGKFLRVEKIVVSKRSLSLYQDKSKIWKLLDLISSRFSSIIVGNSQAVIDDTIARDGVSANKCKIIYNALREEFFVPKEISEQEKSNKKIKIVCIANLIAYKGHAELITAFKQVRLQYPTAELFLAGEDRGLGPELVKLAKDLSVHESINFMGRVSDVPALLAQSDIGVLTSHEEGFSNAVIELLSGGLPIVATKVGGTPEALANIPDCILIEPRNENEIASALKKIIANLHEIQTRSDVRSGLAKSSYSIAAMTKKYAEIYNS